MNGGRRQNRPITGRGEVVAGAALAFGSMGVQRFCAACRPKE